MYQNEVIIFFVAFFLSIVATLIIKKIALYFCVIDVPDNDRKRHGRPVPLLGGVAIFLAFFISLAIVHSQLTSGSLEAKHWIGVFLGACVIIIGGVLDDKYRLSPKLQIIFPIVACLLVVAGGVNIDRITNPLGGYILLDSLKLAIFSWQGVVYYFVVFSDLLILFWLMGMMYTTKLLDGIDGLVTGVTAIGGIIIFLFTMTEQYYQPDVGIAALVLSAVCLGFIIFNWYPAKIFLGDSGSLLLGFILGVLAIISGGKIAIALLVFGLPILDLVWTIVRRLLARKNPFSFADRKHLHFRLLDLGIGQKRTVIIYYLFSLLFGFSALFLQSLGKVLALSLLIIIMLFFIIFFNYIDKKKKLLLHVCCIGCGAYVAEVLQKDYQVSLFFYNPGIYPEEEYIKREEEARRIAKKFNLKIYSNKYEHEKWREKVKGYENEPEKGKRCYLCYQDRFEETAKFAKKKRIKYFASTLSVSPHKDINMINQVGKKIAEKYSMEFIDKDFKKNNGFKKSCELSRELNLYRQNYCGCEFSIRKNN